MNRKMVFYMIGKIVQAEAAMLVMIEELLKG